MTSLGGFQARVNAWAISKGWSNARILDPKAVPTEAETKLALLAGAHSEIDALAELVRKDPSTDIGKFGRGVELPTAPDCCLPIVLSKLELISTENTEAIDATISSGLASYLDPARANEAMPAGKPEGLGPELADIVIRCFQLAGDVRIDLAAECERKMDYNDGRPHMHGKHA